MPTKQPKVKSKKVKKTWVIMIPCGSKKLAVRYSKMFAALYGTAIVTKWEIPLTS